jgi:hypothetical protein
MVRVSHFANAGTSVRVTSSSQASPDTASPLDRSAVFLVVPPQPSARGSAIRLAIRSRADEGFVAPPPDVESLSRGRSLRREPTRLE